jgi:hypothetical protein
VPLSKIKQNKYPKRSSILSMLGTWLLLLVLVIQQIRVIIMLYGGSDDGYGYDDYTYYYYDDDDFGSERDNLFSTTLLLACLVTGIVFGLQLVDVALVAFGKPPPPNLRPSPSFGSTALSRCESGF